MASGIVPNNVENNQKRNGVGRREIKAAIAKAVELRALHAALFQTSSPSGGNNFSNNCRQNSSSSCNSPILRPLSGFSAQDYPVFTPSYEDEASVTGYGERNPKLTESWDECVGMEEEEEEDDGDDEAETGSALKITPPRDLNPQICAVEDRRFPQTDFYESGRRNNNLDDLRSVSSCNRCKASSVTGGFDTRSAKNSNIIVPLTDTHSSLLSSQPRNRGVMSWLFPKLKKKKVKNNEISYGSPNNRTEASNEFSQVLGDSGVMTMEKLKRQLVEANGRRDAALMEVSEMKSSLGELSQKLEYLENYCERLKKALKQATSASREAGNLEKIGAFSRKSTKRSMDGNLENPVMPVSDEVMVEGFLQIVSEARLSVKQFLKTLISQIDQKDEVLTANLNSLLQPFNLSLDSKHAKNVQYHLEAIVSNSLYQDFENRVFQKDGTPKFLDPEQERQAQFSSFVSLRNLSWDEVLKKGTKYYSEELSRFCDQKMSLIITTLNWTRPWSEKLLQAFFVVAKCMWLLHLLAFSFKPALEILRVEENRAFDGRFMEDMGVDKQRMLSRGMGKVKVMVMPGFYVHDRVLRCKVLCKQMSEK